MNVFCCNCNAEVEVRLTDGKEIYPHRPDLYRLPFWKHDRCGGFVGCHHKTKERTKPLGCIPTEEIKNIRKAIHAILDPMWMKKQHSRKYIYQKLSNAIGREYHTAEIRSINEANAVISKLKELSNKSRHTTD